MELAGKLALVTGGGRGIGRACALELAEAGADILVNYLRNSDAAEETAQAVRALGRQAEIIRSHVGDPDKVDRMFGEIGDRWGYLDILVNNAASGVIRPLRELETRHWDWTMNINARGAWLCAKAAAPLMDGRGGRIVGISSLGGGRVFPEYSAVGISKAALESLTRYLAIELSALGIAVNAVSGGLVDTDALSHFPRREEMLGDAKSKTPAGRMVEPVDIARAVRFLCGPGGEMIRGHILVVDGGYSLPI
ncbi:MAG: enoyl-[acyl-carrier-protein] reductase FabL [Chloroflexi bacterium]|nr:enoyl-[acyl-carrier-protein] reductase FabL [Chloroflexota bacterium]